MGGFPRGKMAQRLRQIGLIVLAWACATLAIDQPVQLKFKDTRPFPYLWTIIEHYKDAACTQPYDYYTYVSHNSSCTTYSSYGRETCTASDPTETLSQCRNTLSSFKTTADGVEWFHDLKCQSPKVHQITGECTSLFHDIWAKILSVQQPLTSPTSRQLVFQIAANPDPSNPASTCLVDSWSSNWWNNQIPDQTKYQTEVPWDTTLNVYFEMYPFRSCVQVLQKDTIKYFLTPATTPDTLTSTFHTFNTRDCQPSRGVAGTVSSRVLTRTDARSYYNHLNPTCINRRHCWQGKTADNTLLEAAFEHHHCVNNQCRGGNPGDMCSKNEDCKYCAADGTCCDTTGSYGCENVCVVVDADQTKDMTHNCPPRIVHVRHCDEREMGWPGHNKFDVPAHLTAYKNGLPLGMTTHAGWTDSGIRESGGTTIN